MHQALFAFLIVLLGAVFGCDRGTDPPDHRDHQSDLTDSARRPTLSRKTTDEHIAVANLNASIAELQRRLGRGARVGIASALVDRLLLRSELYARPDDSRKATEIARRMVAIHPESPEAMLLCARASSALHRFDLAGRWISRARDRLSQGFSIRRSAALGEEIALLETTIGLAQGAPVEWIVARRRALAARQPTFQSLTSLALALVEAGRFDEADAAFRTALGRYRDVSPFPFAWVAYQRGVMWTKRASRPDLGRPLLEEAVTYLPGYVVANLELAAIDSRLQVGRRPPGGR